MIIEPGPDKDIEAQREAGPSGAQSGHAAPSASTSAVSHEQYDHGHVDDGNEDDGLLAGTAPLPGTYHIDIVTSRPQIDLEEPLGPPPEFAPYEAEWFEVGNGDVVSHDEHLNTDGEALYRFLLTQASQHPPGYRIHCRGTHKETRYRFVNSNGFSDSHHSGGSSTRTESYQECITDFDFHIDVMPPFPSSHTTPAPPPVPVDAKTRTDQPPLEEHIIPPQDDCAPIHWSVADNEPVYRGKMVREVEVPASSNGPGPIFLPEDDLPLTSSTTSYPTNSSGTHPRIATHKEQKEYSQWIKQRTGRGLPPWVYAPGLANGQWNQATLATSDPACSMTSSSASNTNPTSPRGVLKSSRTVRQWADSYCSSPKLLKEFIYTKLLYGWDVSQLESAIRSTIALAPYHGDIEVYFTPINSKIYIRPSNRLSRWLSNAWLKFISIILFIFPFIWLFKRFHSQGGGKWEVCGGAYALKRWVPLIPPRPSLGQSQDTAASSSGGGNRDGELPSYDDIASPSTLSPTSSPLINTSSFPLPSVSSPSLQAHAQSQARIIQTPSGPYKLVGQREGEWFRYWEPVILRAVLTRYQSTVPLTSHSELYGRYAAPGSALEGYRDAPFGATVAPIVGQGLSAPFALDGYNPVYRPHPRRHW